MAGRFWLSRSIGHAFQGREWIPSITSLKWTKFIICPVFDKWRPHGGVYTRRFSTFPFGTLGGGSRDRCFPNEGTPLERIYSGPEAHLVHDRPQSSLPSGSRVKLCKAVESLAKNYSDTLSSCDNSGLYNIFLSFFLLFSRAFQQLEANQSLCPCDGRRIYIHNITVPSLPLSVLLSLSFSLCLRRRERNFLS